ncbi:amino acid adenylation domain-containing protein [Roseimarinus sediminis]|uniref:amino acid adenylation domain-containing protein n=1 Tax=Roseimarinus sediminis TaxID=1610899 RepID=UPI003D1A65AB
MKFFLEQLCDNFETYAGHAAFHIEGSFYTYAELGARVSAVQQLLFGFPDEQYFGVVTRNRIDTYATIFALWLTGKTSVPISPKNPVSRNAGILKEMEIATLFDSSHDEVLQFDGIKSIATSHLKSERNEPVVIDVPLSSDLYVLFTSGSTGQPKGVCISRANLDAFLKGFFACGYEFTPADRCIQVYELTFDASVQCYTFPLLVGATVYTIPDQGVRFLSIMKVLQSYQITFVKMTPSVIYYLEPYFRQISLPHLRYCLFGAEAFPADLVTKWEKCIPNAEIHNVYGPTEASINCSWYKWQRGRTNKVMNGIASIGSAFQNLKLMVIDDKLKPVPAGTKGELCVAGPQVTRGYWKRPEIDAQAFFEYNHLRFYRTGDLVMEDEDGDLLFIGRIDDQVQIDGHRIEPGEIAWHAIQQTGVKCVAMVTQRGALKGSIVLFVEDEKVETDKLQQSLAKVLPPYMVPGKIIVMEQLPLLSSGKTDRVQLEKMMEDA